jgi:hypothetical protein
MNILGIQNSANLGPSFETEQTFDNRYTACASLLFLMISIAF